MRGFVLMTLVSGLLISGASAAVYEIQMTVTTTRVAEGKVSAKSNYCEAEGKIVYRKPAKIKLRGLVWGTACECDEGAVFWNETEKYHYADDSAFAWDFLNRIGAKGDESEGLWTLDLQFDSGDHAGCLTGGGTGKIKKPDQVSLSGNLAGYMYAGQVVKTEQKGTCVRCGETSVTVLDAVAWSICGCDEVANDHTVAHGTWQMKYNAKASESYDKTGDIEASYRFPDYVGER